jgi:hypothetical protein
MHTHTYQRQTLRHDHPGGDKPHGYYGHPEDAGSPAFGEGTYEPGDSLAGALAEVDRVKGYGFTADGTAKRCLVRALFDLAETVRARTAMLQDDGMAGFDPATALLRLDQAVVRMAQYPRVTKDGQLASILGGLRDELDAATYLRPLYAVTRDHIEHLAGREVSDEEVARIAMAIEFSSEVSESVRAAVGQVIDLASEDSTP